MWHKRGLVFEPAGRAPWMHSHAQLPTPAPLRGDVMRVYFASRTAEQRSHIGYADVRIGSSYEVINWSREPLLAPGPIGHFDEHGVFPASVVADDRGRLLMFYVGWTQGVKAPLFYASIGLAISEDGGQTFHRSSPAPLLSRSEHDPCLVTSPNVVRDERSWHMYYVSGVRWTEKADGSLQSHYHIKYASSADGLTWNRDGRVAIDFRGPEETNIARASVVRMARDRWLMWYSYVRPPASRYRIGFATSRDGLAWMRRDDDGALPPSAAGFDDEMTCYPQVVVAGTRAVMLYNGNRFGAAGFGIADCETSALAAITP